VHLFSCFLDGLLSAFTRPPPFRTEAYRATSNSPAPNRPDFPSPEVTRLEAPASFEQFHLPLFAPSLQRRPYKCACFCVPGHPPASPPTFQGPGLPPPPRSFDLRILPPPACFALVPYLVLSFLAKRYFHTLLPISSFFYFERNGSPQHKPRPFWETRWSRVPPPTFLSFPNRG